MKERVYRFSHGCGCKPTEASRPSARPIEPGDGCIRNPRTNWALRLHSCRALSSQPQTKSNPLLPTPEQPNQSVTYVPGWNLCARKKVSPLYRNIHYPHETRIVPRCTAKRAFFFSLHLRIIGAPVSRRFSLFSRRAFDLHLAQNRLL